MKYLLDTNAISEPYKAKPHPQLMEWMAAVDPTQIYISAVTIGEMRYGIELRRKVPSHHAAVDMLEQRLARMESLCADRILSFDRSAAQWWGRVYACYPHLPTLIDTQIAAIALANDATLVTRDQDLLTLAGKLVMHGIALRVFNPFEDIR